MNKETILRPELCGKRLQKVTTDGVHIYVHTAQGVMKIFGTVVAYTKRDPKPEPIVISGKINA